MQWNVSQVHWKRFPFGFRFFVHRNKSRFCLIIRRQFLLFLTTEARGQLTSLVNSNYDKFQPASHRSKTRCRLIQQSGSKSGSPVKHELPSCKEPLADRVRGDRSVYNTKCRPRIDFCRSQKKLLGQSKRERSNRSGISVRSKFSSCLLSRVIGSRARNFN